MKNKSISIFEKFDIPIIIISFVLTLAVVISTVLNPQGTIDVADAFYSIVTEVFGAPILIFVFICALLCMWIGLSKYGNIRLGNSKPEFSTFSYIAMMTCSGFGSGTIYWAFMESASYITAPPFGAEPYTAQAADWAIAYNFHHWGPIAWCMFCIASLPIAYAYHVRKSPTLRVSEICSTFVSKKYSKLMAKFVDYVYILSTIAGIAFFVALSAPVISAILSSYTGIEDGFALSGGIVIVVSIIYTVSSYMGVEKGMKKLSDIGIYLTIIFFVATILLGDSLFIMNQTTSGIAMFMQNVISMCLYTDAVGQGGFPQDWTVFFWSYWLIYAPFMGVFVAKISKGRTLREVVGCMVIGGGLGTGIFLAALNSFSLNLQFTGQVDMAKMLADGQGTEAIVAALSTIPFGNIIMVILSVCMLILMATTLDGSAFALATNAQKTGKSSQLLRVFWCVSLTLLPLALMYVDAPVNTLQTCTLIFSIPIIIILFIMIRAFFKSLKEDFGDKTSTEIIDENRVLEIKN